MSHRNVTLHSLLMQLATTVRDLCQRQIDKSRLLENLNLDAIVLYLLRENGLASDRDGELVDRHDEVYFDMLGEVLVRLIDDGRWRLIDVSVIDAKAARRQAVPA